MNTLCPMPGCHVTAVTTAAADQLDIAARGARLGGHCPECGKASRAVHSRYQRHLADLPSLGRRVRVALRVRRFYCRNPGCRRRTFTERLPDLLAPHARRTGRLGTAQGRAGVALGGEAAARLLKQLAMPTSADTVLRLIRRLPLPQADIPRIIGIDDWALRKRRTYGTVVVDLERRRVVDLLPDRTSATVADWLRQRPGVEVVARDRSTEYARAASIGAPNAVQVADRWHLLANMRQALERWLHSVHARLRRLPPGSTGPALPPRREQAFRRTGPERAARAERHTRWQARYDEVRHRHLAGEPLMAIARAMGLARSTVRKFACADNFPARLPHGPMSSILDPFLPYLQRRLADGCENGMMLWRELRDLGFAGGNQPVHRWLAERRTMPAKAGRPRLVLPSDTTTSAGRPVSPLPAARQLAWMLVQPVAMLDAAAAATVSRVEQDGEAKIAAGLTRQFTALLRACGVRGRTKGTAPAAPLTELDRWLAEAQACGIGAIETFAAGLDVDGAAVRAALTEQWSSGQAEGQINRLKLLKRQSYGRASFDLLRRRVLLAA
jgi:transposase